MKKHRWTIPEKEFVEANAGLLSDKELSIALSNKFHQDYSIHAVRKYRQRLCLPKIGHRNYFKLKNETINP